MIVSYDSPAKYRLVSGNYVLHTEFTSWWMEEKDTFGDTESEMEALWLFVQRFARTRFADRTHRRARENVVLPSE